MSDSVLLSEDGIMVSTARLVTGGTTYAISGITSVAMADTTPEPTSERQGTVLTVIGAGVLLFALVGVLEWTVWWHIPIILSGVGCVIFGLTRPPIVTRHTPSFTVLVRSASGESSALTTPDRDLATRVVAAVNEAIVHRSARPSAT